MQTLLIDLIERVAPRRGFSAIEDSTSPDSTPDNWMVVYHPRLALTEHTHYTDLNEADARLYASLCNLLSDARFATLEPYLRALKPESFPLPEFDIAALETQAQAGEVIDPRHVLSLITLARSLFRIRLAEGEFAEGEVAGTILSYAPITPEQLMALAAEMPTSGVDLHLSDEHTWAAQDDFCRRHTTSPRVMQSWSPEGGVPNDPFAEDTARRRAFPSPPLTPDPDAFYADQERAVNEKLDQEQAEREEQEWFDAHDETGLPYEGDDRG